MLTPALDLWKNFKMRMSKMEEMENEDAANSIDAWFGILIALFWRNEDVKTPLYIFKSN